MPRHTLALLTAVVPLFVLAAGAAATPRPAETDPPGTVAITPSDGTVASSFSLSPGQLVYNDDEHNTAVPPATSSTLHTPITTDASPLTVGKTTTIKAGDSGGLVPPEQQADPTTPLASGSTTAYPSAFYTTTHGNEQLRVESLTVTAPHRTRTISHILIEDVDNFTEWHPELSGNRLTYLAETGSGPAYVIYDIAKNTTTRIAGAQNAYDGTPVPSVSGNYVAYMTEHGSIWRRDLNTGAVSEIAGPVISLDGGTVFASGDYVAWSRDVETVDSDENNSGYENAVTRQHVYLGHSLVTDLSRSGPVLVNGGSGTGQASLQTLAGLSVPITSTANSPTSAFPSDVVQVEGSTASWIDDDGTLQAAPLPIAVPAPRMEGDTLAPKPDRPNVKWHGYAPYDEPLTSCSMAVMSGTRTVATLACNTAYMAKGIADVAWDGRIGSHTAPAGTYHYEITAAGVGGGALDSAGTIAPVTGHFTID